MEGWGGFIRNLMFYRKPEKKNNNKGSFFLSFSQRPRFFKLGNERFLDKLKIGFFFSQLSILSDHEQSVVLKDCLFA